MNSNIDGFILEQIRYESHCKMFNHFHDVHRFCITILNGFSEFIS